MVSSSVVRISLLVIFLSDENYNRILSVYEYI